MPTEHGEAEDPSTSAHAAPTDSADEFYWFSSTQASPPNINPPRQKRGRDADSGPEEPHRRIAAA